MTELQFLYGREKVVRVGSLFLVLDLLIEKTRMLLFFLVGREQERDLEQGSWVEILLLVYPYPRPIVEVAYIYCGMRDTASIRRVVYESIDGRTKFFHRSDGKIVYIAAGE
jgi:hypothetical protein